jgi:hypothetical protein
MLFFKFTKKTGPIEAELYLSTPQMIDLVFLTLIPYRVRWYVAPKPWKFVLSCE